MAMLHKLLAMIAVATLAACQTNDLAEPPVSLGDFALGLNVVVADDVQMVALSRKTTPDAWETAMQKAIEDRFGEARYSGTRLYNIGIAVEAYALAPPGVPIVLTPKSILVVTANVWEDATQTKLNPEGEQFHIFEKGSPESVVGSGLMQSKAEQMEILAYNTAKRIEQWFLDNPQWFGLPADGQAATAAVETKAAPNAAPAPGTTAAPAPATTAAPAAVASAAKPAPAPVDPGDSFVPGGIPVKQ